MKPTIELLSLKDKVQLALLYDREEYQSLRKLIEIERLELAKGLLNITGDKDERLRQLAFVQGQAYALKMIHKLVKDINKSSIEKEKKAKN